MSDSKDFQLLNKSTLSDQVHCFNPAGCFSIISCYPTISFYWRILSANDHRQEHWDHWEHWISEYMFKWFDTRASQLSGIQMLKTLREMPPRKKNICLTSPGSAVKTKGCSYLWAKRKEPTHGWNRWTQGYGCTHDVPGRSLEVSIFVAKCPGQLPLPLFFSHQDTVPTVTDRDTWAK